MSAVNAKFATFTLTPAVEAAAQSHIDDIDTLIDGLITGVPLHANRAAWYLKYDHHNGEEAYAETVDSDWGSVAPDSYDYFFLSSGSVNARDAFTQSVQILVDASPLANETLSVTSDAGDEYDIETDGSGNATLKFYRFGITKANPADSPFVVTAREFSTITFGELGARIRHDDVPAQVTLTEGVGVEDLDDGSWTGKITATADAPGGSLSDFFFIAALNSSMTELWAAVRSNSGDLRVKVDGTQVPCFVPSATWNYAGTSGLILFPRPGAASSAPTIDIYFGNASASTAPANDALGQYAVFPSTLKAFYLAGAGNDLTSNLNNLTMGGSPTVGGVAGPINGSLGTDYNGSTQYGEATAAIPTSVPVTFFASFRPDNTTVNHGIMGVGRDDVGDQYRMLFAYGDGDDKINALTRNSDSYFAPSVASFTSGAWQTAGAVFTSSTSRQGGINGTLGTAETTSSVPTTPNIMRVGNLARSDATTWLLDGRLAFVGADAQAWSANWFAYWHAMLADSDQSDFYNGWTYSAVEAPASAPRTHSRLSLGLGLGL
jgi:hypothetical protein